MKHLKNTLSIIHRAASWGIYYSEDKELVDYLSQYYTVEIVDWQDTNPEFLKDKIVLLRHPHNYLKKLGDFKQWYHDVERCSKVLINPYLSVTKSLSKEYLFFFQKKGVSIVPSIIIKDSTDWNQILRTDWNHIIVKPLYAESGIGVKKINKITDDFDVQKYLQQYGPYLCQQFLPEIKKGEISLYFINSKYTHTTISRPKSHNDYKVSWQRVEQINPRKSLVKLTDKALHIWPYKTMYARIDWIKDGNDYFLSEFEVIDPMFNNRCLNNQTKTQVFETLLSMIKKNAKN